ncbi:MAG: hypothetical protein CL908_02245 [Deltaproteobacteria bacterium]|jgi:hypothetical protein|nr:hypothetical protein [Deltaproteobacteria bacterium]
MREPSTRLENAVVETLISLGLIVVFCSVGFAASAGAEAMIWGGIGLSAIGFAYGIPTAAIYHWTLRQSLVRAKRLPARWWLRATAHHDLIPREERAGVLVWGAIGGTGFLVIVLGIVLTSIGLWRMLAA